MRATELLHNLGQSIWLDGISRQLLGSGTLAPIFQELAQGRHRASFLAGVVE